jgi:hypothetical protein
MVDNIHLVGVMMVAECNDVICLESFFSYSSFNAITSPLSVVAHVGA